MWARRRVSNSGIRVPCWWNILRPIGPADCFSLGQAWFRRAGHWNVSELARNAGLQIEEIARPGSDAIARLGWKKILAGDTIIPENLEANYIRRSDAEIFSKPVP